MKIDKIAFIFYRCYLITTDNYPQNNYSICLKHQKDLLNLDNCIFLSLTDEQDVYLELN